MKRIVTLDLARGFTVLMMAPIHTMMLYSQPRVQTSLTGMFLSFIAEGPGAQLFMLLMGVGFTFSSHTGSRAVLKRAGFFLIAAYCLNFLKFIIPLLLGGIPATVLQELHLQGTGQAFLFFLLMGDILHFAALAYPILYLVHRMKHYPYWSLFFALAVTLFSSCFWNLKTGFSLIDYPLSLIGGHPPDVYFPLFPWLLYPLVGLALGDLLKHHPTSKVLTTGAKAGFVLIVLSFFLPGTPMQGNWLPFYRTGISGCALHLGIVLLWLALFHYLYRKIPINPVFQLLVFCSENITPIYLIQWVLIAWIFPFVGYHTLGLTATLVFIMANTLFTLLLTRSLNKFYVK